MEISDFLKTPIPAGLELRVDKSPPKAPKAPAIPAERAVPQFCVLENCTASSKVWACEANVNPRRTDNMITFFIMCWFKFIF